ncbi:MAG: glutathione S-transferase family protein [Planctomycetota bacterium]|jgi:glutathione S-transferase
MNKLTLLTLPPSPYNTKVRLALKYKGLDFETKEFGFEDREEVVRASGQPLTPVLLDGEKAVYDSFGILRYLDANFPGPALFRADKEGQREIQDWETFAKELGVPLRLVLMQVLNGAFNDEDTAKANALLEELPKRIEEALDGQDFLMGSELNAADLSVVPFLRFVVADPMDVAEGPIRAVVERLHLSEAFPRTRAWVERVMELDAVPAH